ncbi:hypothetical protein H696_04616 [Fonticula alba]|uniref:Uncharacterized protein n=1 Tax=Fonticula alba TaxID=691883 RepID=A0A058Z4K7_FONAL|nr:hypothetical protein H696_04616 [Fonticula alba]KCV69205.1 hypothetical protein H696_04616 [Fonticula alba]|eukprot:XP_009496776.1 hypothetical protein H696_04616 [Fonticula alba]
MSNDIWWVLKSGDVDALSSMLPADAATLRDPNGISLVHAAADYGHVDILRLLISRGLPVNEVDSSGFTPLELAAMEGHYNATVFLLESGASGKIV